MLLILYILVEVCTTLFLAVKLPVWMAVGHEEPDGVDQVFSAAFGIVGGLVWPAVWVVAAVFFIARKIRMELAKQV